jgi:DNA repair exonuclease SbcCD ATPase subunit
MRVQLHGFRCYDDREFEFEGGGVCLVDSPSGTGKSTIFRAITWCLYGTYKNTSHHENPSTKMWVRLELDGFSIHRQRNTTLLQVVHNGIVLEGPVAQAEIDKHFGSISLWNSACYIEQKKYNYLLGAPASAKMDLLNSIAFETDNPKDYINVVVNAIKDVEMRMSVAQTSYTNDVNSFNNTMSINKIDMSNYREPDEVAAMATTIPALKSQLDQYRANLSALRSGETQRNMLLKQENDILSQISRTPTADPQDITRKTEMQSKYQEALFHRQTMEAKRSIVDSIDVPPPPIDNPPRYTQYQISQLQAQNTQYNNNLRNAMTLGVEYDRQSISNMVSTLRENLGHQYKFPMVDSIRQLRAEIDNMESHIKTDYTEASLLSLRDELAVLERSRDVISCPHCTGSVRYVRGAWEIAHEHKFDNTAYLELQHRISDAARQLELSRQLTAKKEQLKLALSTSNIDIPEGCTRMTQHDILLCNTKISSLLQIAIVEPTDTQLPESCARWWEMEDRRVAAEQEYMRAKANCDRYGDVQPVDSKQLEIDRFNLITHQTLSQQLSLVRFNLNQIQCQKDMIASLITSINELNTKIALMESQYSSARIVGMLVEQHKSLLSRHSEIGNMNTYLLKLQRFKEMAIRDECDSLTNTVDVINSFLDKNAQFIFTDPITIELSLFKTIKTTGLEKPIVNLHIMYKGGELTDTESLSDGEKERISLLLTLAMYKVTNKKVLILDESLVSLDGDSKSKCNKLIRVITGLEEDWRTAAKTEGDGEPFQKSDALVLVVSHETCDGLYDRVINL